MQGQKNYLTGQDIHTAYCSATLNFTKEWEDCSFHVQAMYEEIARKLNFFLGVCDPYDVFSEDKEDVRLYTNDAIGKLHLEVDTIVCQCWEME